MSSLDAMDESEAAMPKVEAIPEIFSIEVSTVGEPTSMAVIFGATLEALTSAAALLLPAAMSTADVAAAKREARVDGGVPVTIVPLANASAITATRFAARFNPAVVPATAAPFDAALTAVAVIPAGSAAYDDADTVVVELTDAEKPARTRIVTVIVPSVFVEVEGTTVKLYGTTPPVAACIASYAAETASLCKAAITPGSFALAGRANDRVSVIGTVTVSVKLMTTVAASARVAKCVTKMLRDGDATSAEDGENAEGLPSTGDEARVTVDVPHTVAPPSDDEPAP